MADERTEERELSEFEGEFGRLKSAVSRLESGELSLEDAFREWEAGCSAYVACRTILQSAKSRIEMLAGSFGGEAHWDIFGDAESDAER